MRSRPYPEESRRPRYLTSFVGRQQEITEVTRLLQRDDVRLLTLLGPGGAGKTRLAVEAVGRLGEDTWDDIWFVSLVAVRDPTLVLPTIAQSLGVHQATDRPIESAIAHVLQYRHTLLVIDNVETVAEAAPDLGQLLIAAPTLTMLITSRVVLHISGEHIFLVNPLDTPQAARLPLNHLHTIESVQLFLDRASASGRPIVLDASNAADICEICRRLDGLPLALELAAARCALLSPTALLALLQSVPGILSDGASDAPERHRSMHDAIAWSYDLLPDHEQAAFRRLAVFNGEFTVGAAEAVVDLQADTLDIVTSLAAKSLIVPTRSDDAEPRFTMLETIREFGLDQLSAMSEADAVRDRHAAWFLDEALQSEYAWLKPFAEGFTLMSRLEANRANMREALGWLFRSGNISEALRMAGSLGTLWVVCGHANEGRIWLERLLAVTSEVDSLIHANALGTLSWIGNQQGEIEEAFRLAGEGLNILQEHDAPFLTVRCLVLSAVAAGELGKIEMANTQLKEAMERTLMLDGPDWWGNWIHAQLVQLGYNAFLEGQIDEAAAYFDKAINQQTARGHEPGISGYHVLAGLGRIARVRGDLAQALLFFQQSLDFTQHFPNLNVSVVNFSIRTISLIAGTIAGLGQLENAVRLFGASDALQKMYGYEFAEAANLQHAFGIPPQPHGHGKRARPRQASHDTPGLDWNSPPGRSLAPEALMRAWEEGQALSLEMAIAEALAAVAESATGREPASSHGLSPREIEVLCLVAEGRSNRAIADILCLSERTVEHHITHILARLDLESRIAAAIFAVRNGLV